MAVDLVVREGHQALTTRRLAAELGCSQGALFLIVPSLHVLRDDVLCALVARAQAGQRVWPEGRCPCRPDAPCGSAR